MRPRKPIGAAARSAKLEEVQVAVRREAAGAEADPCDEVMVAAVTGVVESMKAEGDALAEIGRCLGKLARA